MNIPTTPPPARSESPALPPRKRWTGRRWLVLALAACSLLVLSAVGYGHWLSTERLAWSEPADCVVTLSGYNQYDFAARWIEQGQVRAVWLIRTRNTRLMEMGIHEQSTKSSVRELSKRGVADSRVRVIPVDAVEGDLPSILQAIGQAAEREGTRQIVVQCHLLEPRFLRQVADAALPAGQSNRLRFVALPDDDYTATRWWACRSGWKGVYDISMQLVSNLVMGPLSGFESPPWNPDEWEAETFPNVLPPSP